MNQSREGRRRVYVGVAESTMAVKCSVYDQEKLRNMAVGATIMFMNIIVKPNNSITITTVASQECVRLVLSACQLNMTGQHWNWQSHPHPQGLHLSMWRNHM